MVLVIMIMMGMINRTDILVAYDCANPKLGTIYSFVDIEEWVSRDISHNNSNNRQGTVLCISRSGVISNRSKGMPSEKSCILILLWNVKLCGGVSSYHDTKKN